MLCSCQPTVLKVQKKHILGWASCLARSRKLRIMPCWVLSLYFFALFGRSQKSRPNGLKVQKSTCICRVLIYAAFSGANAPRRAPGCLCLSFGGPAHYYSVWLFFWFIPHAFFICVLHALFPSFFFLFSIFFVCL